MEYGTEKQSNLEMAQKLFQQLRKQGYSFDDIIIISELMRVENLIHEND